MLTCSKRIILNPLGQKCLNKVARIKRTQILNTLADANIANRNAELIGHREDHAAFGGAVQLGQVIPVNPTASWNSLPRLIAFCPVLASMVNITSCGVDVQLFHYPDNLLQLFHQVRFILQTPGGIGNQYVNMARLRRLNGVENHRGGVGAGVLGDHRDIITLAPDLQLFHRRRTEGIPAASITDLPCCSN